MSVALITLPNGDRSDHVRAGLFPQVTVSHAVVDGLERPQARCAFRGDLQFHQSRGLAGILVHGLPRPDLLVSVLKEMIRVTNCAKGPVVSSGARRWAELRWDGDVTCSTSWASRKNTAGTL
ncbi:hypothetical protein VP01_10569g1 [Puccinia sorghi]|uniref:Uncharacterized protein n=1 Tax=Puccinia sorghi TaxID=27349 RepID=A0A0L6VUA6_9BASI|nr:hypothetical protein VP01_10569g1 [Puccinia sorghi]